MPRNDEGQPSRRPLSVPLLILTTGGFRLGPVTGFAGDAGAAGFSCAKASPATPATTPPRRAVVVPSICRRFIPADAVCDGLLAMLPPRLREGCHLTLLPPGGRHIHRACGCSKIARHGGAASAGIYTFRDTEMKLLRL